MFSKFTHSLAINFLLSIGSVNFQVFVMYPKIKQLSLENKQLSSEFTDLRKVIQKYHK
jgi:hypothetical protein